MNLAMCDIQPFLLQASSGSSSIAADSSASAAGTDSDSEAARLFGDEEDIFEPLASGGAAGCHVVAEGGVDAEGGAGSCPLLAASSGDMPPPAPPLAAPARPAPSVAEGSQAASSQAGDRDVAQEVFYHPNGKVSFYEKNGRFQCVCSKHPSCQVTRTSRANASRPGQGRPLGAMIAWLDLGSKPDIKTKSDHRSPWLWGGLAHSTRLEARRQLRATGGASIESCERPRATDEADSEPEVVP